jgi:hypothetical protein
MAWTLIERAADVRVTGWMSPHACNSPRSPRLLAEAGYIWHGDCHDDDLPALLDIEGRAEPLVSIPLTFDISDLAHCVRHGQAPSALIDQLRVQLERATVADRQPFLIDVTAHAHVFGRPAGAWVFDTMMKLALGRKDVWITTRSEIAAYALAHAGAHAGYFA